MPQDDSGTTATPRSPHPIVRLITSQPVRYLLVAGIAALFYLAVLALGLALGLHYLVAILIAQVVTIGCAFPAYRTFVFQSRGRVLTDFVRFLSVWVSGAIAGILVTPLLVELLGWHPLVAQVVAIVVVSVASFLGHRFFSFRDRARSRGRRPSDPEEAVE